MQPPNSDDCSLFGSPLLIAHKSTKNKYFPCTSLYAAQNDIFGWKFTSSGNPTPKRNVDFFPTINRTIAFKINQF